MFAPKTVRIIWLSKLSILIVPDDGYFRNVSCAQHLISTVLFQLHVIHNLHDIVILYIEKLVILNYVILYIGLRGYGNGVFCHFQHYISDISWRSVFLMEETRVPGENQ